VHGAWLQDVWTCSANMDALSHSLVDAAEDDEDLGDEIQDCKIL
jgi:hypothetical protein